MRARWILARKEFTSIFTEKTILLAVVIQVFVAGFSGFLVVGLASLVDPDAIPAAGETRLALVGDNGLADVLESYGMRIRNVNATLAHELFREGHVEGVIEVGNASWEGSDPIRLRVTLPDGTLESTMTLVKVKRALEDYERAVRDARGDRLVAEPLYVEVPAGGGSYAFVYSLLVPLLVFLPIVLSGALAADSLTEEVHRGTLPLLLTTPATAADVVEGKLLANAALAPLLTAAWLGLLSLNNLGLSFADAAWITLFAFVLAVVMGLLACLIAILTRDRNKAHMLYALALIALMAGSMALPMSPVNVVARLAAGSADAAVHAEVAALALLAFAGLFALDRILKTRAAEVLSWRWEGKPRVRRRRRAESVEPASNE
ncbi:MAG TPA: ABC transporter permease subunit [Candidatus Thermoplasmatota archaeon]|nr:ABC transporter permease subunit [Candidatus Thermoplasmatota archaeon]